jgi:hypothetical protein
MLYVRPVPHSILLRAFVSSYLPQNLAILPQTAPGSRVTRMNGQFT